MNSSLFSEARAIFLKEFRTEIRSPQGLLTAGLFSLVSVVTIALATYNMRVPPTMAAGLYWVIVMFAIVASLPRTFIAEEELLTGDLLRLTARPHAVYWGKQVFGLLQAWVTALFVAGLFFLLANQPIKDPVLMMGSILAGTAALSSAVTFCGALAARATNRQALAAAIALPQILPVSTWAVTAMRAALGDGFADSGRLAVLGLAGYAILAMVNGPYLYAALWKK
jgi:heme exporter protein B